MGPIHTRDHSPGCSGADPELAAGQTGGGSYIMPIQECNRGREPLLPSEHLEALNYN